MAFQNLLTENRDAVRLITINRPDKLNALDQQTITELWLAFAQAAADDDVRVIVLTGAGPKAFVAGADIAQMRGLSAVQARDFSRLGQQLMRRIETLGKPVIAMINGFALGGGMELAIACHLRIASTAAKLGQPEINLGLIPGFGGTQRLLRLAGRAAALELCLIGSPVSAERAYALGLVNAVVAPEQLSAHTQQLAEQLSHAAPQALRGILDAITIGAEAGLDTALDYETQTFGLIFSTADMQEGTAAFLEKRQPSFTGK